MIFLYAFLIGGAICAVGQILIDCTNLTPARILVIYVIAGVILGAFGVYEPLVKFAGAGASVPLSGFGSLMASGIKDAVKEDGALGVLSGALSSASAGITVAMLSGVIVSLVAKPKEK